MKSSYHRTAGRENQQVKKLWILMTSTYKDKIFLIPKIHTLPFINHFRTSELFFANFCRERKELRQYDLLAVHSQVFCDSSTQLMGRTFLRILKVLLTVSRDI